MTFFLKMLQQRCSGQPCSSHTMREKRSYMRTSIERRQSILFIRAVAE